ncbi:MAG: hypothetical protein EZS28_022477 [Streblomastix strix]|uniref:Uncharacterized protein n=1 Tax=Streblomastix strix TaxID=222440 RepID=A0A5J4VHM1_9EUKA|nr:MAG: hypothetical protein EZS28_022477 [Streblomastix strix]
MGIYIPTEYSHEDKCVEAAFANMDCEDKRKDVCLEAAFRLFTCFAPSIATKHYQFKDKNIFKMIRKMSESDRNVIYTWAENIGIKCRDVKNKIWIEQQKNYSNSFNDQEKHLTNQLDDVEREKIEKSMESISRMMDNTERIALKQDEVSKRVNDARTLQKESMKRQQEILGEMKKSGDGIKQGMASLLNQIKFAQLTEAQEVDRISKLSTELMNDLKSHEKNLKSFTIMLHGISIQQDELELSQSGVQEGIYQLQIIGDDIKEIFDKLKNTQDIIQQNAEEGAFGAIQLKDQAHDEILLKKLSQTRGSMGGITSVLAEYVKKNTERYSKKHYLRIIITGRHVNPNQRIYERLVQLWRFLLKFKDKFYSIDQKLNQQQSQRSVDYNTEVNVDDMQFGSMFAVDDDTACLLQRTPLTQQRRII